MGNDWCVTERVDESAFVPANREKWFRHRVRDGLLSTLNSLCCAVFVMWGFKILWKLKKATFVVTQSGKLRVGGRFKLPANSVNDDQSGPCKYVKVKR